VRTQEPAFFTGRVRGLGVVASLDFFLGVEPTASADFTGIAGSTAGICSGNVRTTELSVPRILNGIDASRRNSSGVSFFIVSRTSSKALSGLMRPSDV